MPLCNSFTFQKTKRDLQLEELQAIRQILEYELGQTPISLLEKALRNDDKTLSRQPLSYDNSYKVIRLHKDKNFEEINGNNVTVLYLPAGNFKIKFGEKNDWIEAKELQRGDIFFLKFKNIYFSGDLDRENPIVFYVG